MLGILMQIKLKENIDVSLRVLDQSWTIYLVFVKSLKSGGNTITGYISYL